MSITGPLVRNIMVKLGNVFPNAIYITAMYVQRCRIVTFPFCHQHATHLQTVGMEAAIETPSSQEQLPELCQSFAGTTTIHGLAEVGVYYCFYFLPLPLNKIVYCFLESCHKRQNSYQL